MMTIRAPASAEDAFVSMHPPRFMSDEQLRAYFGISERALSRLRAIKTFPAKDALITKTDRRAVEIFFDRRSGIAPSVGSGTVAAPDGKENFNGTSKKR